MNPAKAKLEVLRSAAAQIDATDRRKIVEDELRPTLEDLKSDWPSFRFERDSFLRQVATLEIWATQIWTKKDGHTKVPKFLAELSKLELRLKS